MAIEYRFYDRGDESLIETAELPLEGGIAVAVRTTGYEVGTDEVVQMSIVDFAGNELFAQTAKPQNIEEWPASDASGGLSPADVAEAPELFQFEDEIIGLFENATVVVGEHMDFISEIIESSWVSLPSFEPFDLVDQFCASHCTADYPGRPAAVAALEGIAGYYGIDADMASTTGIAQAAASCYGRLVAEHKAERDAKGEAHWADYRRKLEEAERGDLQLQAAKRREAIRANRINAILWLCAAAIFGNLAVQLNVRGFEFGFVVVAAAAAVFFTVRWVMCLYAMFKLSRQK